MDDHSQTALKSVADRMAMAEKGNNRKEGLSKGSKIQLWVTTPNSLRKVQLILPSAQQEIPRQSCADTTSSAQIQTAYMPINLQSRCKALPLTLRWSARMVLPAKILAALCVILPQPKRSNSSSNKTANLARAAKSQDAPSTTRQLSHATMEPTVTRLDVNFGTILLSASSRHAQM